LFNKSAAKNQAKLSHAAATAQSSPAKTPARKTTILQDVRKTEPAPRGLIRGMDRRRRMKRLKLAQKPQQTLHPAGFV